MSARTPVTVFDLRDPACWARLNDLADELNAELPCATGDALSVLALVLVGRVDALLNGRDVVPAITQLVVEVERCYAEHTRGRAKQTATVRRAAVPRRVSARAGRKDHG